MRYLADVQAFSRGPRSRRRAGLRRRLVVAVTTGSVLLATFLGTGTFVLARGYLLDLRERSATRATLADAVVVREGLRTAGRPVSEVLGSLSAESSTVVALRRDGAWYGSALSGSAQDLPSDVLDAVRDGHVVHAWTSLDGRPAVVVGVPLPAVGGELFEIRAADELSQTLTTLRTVLLALTLLTAAVALAAGRRLADVVMGPLHEVGSAAGRIAAGDLGTRLAPTDDPDLSAIVGSFNAMVDTLDERLARDARFAADVSHELRTPLTALVTSVEVLRGRASAMPPGNERLLDVLATGLARLRRLLEDLIELARAEAVPDDTSWKVTDLRELVRHTLTDSGRDPDLLTPGPAVTVRAEPRMLRRAVVNLVENADAHAGGVTRVVVHTSTDDALVHVDDAGPGVPWPDRELIFERFARAGRRTPTSGSGLGLSLVRQIARAHGGDVWCSDTDAGGARFTIRLPRTTAGADR
ncbi:HAMP domain-containing sensor histidine kinase [Kineosporia sp. R_H_3]|uniref:HAMP domain-containing sensor histidine kinase n=1 Tax=Kineosporia sp. R_H_3 TaxID=1961848 RepID=UPI000B4BB49F|nr:HAMP domain-containing sensor histidine kinase [Kineosporia sp. R_H_3]